MRLTYFLTLFLSLLTSTSYSHASIELYTVDELQWAASQLGIPVEDVGDIYSFDADPHSKLPYIQQALLEKFGAENFKQSTLLRQPGYVADGYPLLKDSFTLSHVSLPLIYYAISQTTGLDGVSVGFVLPETLDGPQACKKAALMCVYKLLFSTSSFTHTSEVDIDEFELQISRALRHAYSIPPNSPMRDTANDHIYASLYLKCEKLEQVAHLNSTYDTYI